MKYRLFIACLWLYAVALFVLTLTIIGSVRAEPPTDTLSTLNSIHVGAPRSALHGFACYAAWMEVGYCYHTPQTGDVRGVYVSLDSSERIRTVSMSIRGARIAELESVFGRASSRSEMHTRYADLYKLCYSDHARAVIAVRPFGVSTYISIASEAIYSC